MSRGFEEEIYRRNTNGLQSHSIKKISYKKKCHFVTLFVECPIPGVASVQWGVHMVKHPGAHTKDSSRCTDTEHSP